MSPRVEPQGVDEVTVMVTLLVLAAVSLLLFVVLGVDISDAVAQSVPSSWGLK